MSSGFSWVTGPIITKDEDYCRNDDDLLQACLTSERKDIVRLIGVRRFGKTSFLYKILRHLQKQPEGKGKWRPIFISLQDKEDSLRGYLREVHDRAVDLNQDPTARMLFLVDEVNTAGDPIDRALQKLRVDLVTELVRKASFGSFDGRLRVIFAESSNMDRVISVAPYEDEIRMILKQSLTYLIRGFSNEERRNLLGRAKSIPYERIPNEMLRFVGGHPLMVQLLGYFLDDSDGCTELEEFKQFLPTYNVEASYIAIFEHLHDDDQFILRRMAHENRIFPKSDFSSPGGAGGEVVVSRLATFGLVQGTQFGGYEIGVSGLGDYIRQTRPSPSEQADETTIITWQRLFSNPHPLAGKGGPVPLILHHLSDLHLSPIEKVEDHVTLGAYLRKLEGLSLPKRPHLVILAGDLIDQNPPVEKKEKQRAANYVVPMRAVRDFFAKKTRNLVQRLNANVSSLIVTPGDTDADVDNRGEKENSYTHDFREFSEVFENLAGDFSVLSAQYYRDWNVLIIPLNSANPDEKEDKDRLGALRSEFVKSCMSYEKYRDSEYGCLSDEQLDGLKRVIESMRPRDDAGEFDHALRIAVFHHHLEQLTPATIVDFKNVERVKEAMVENRISVLLHGHSHRNLLFSETLYPHGSRPTISWTIHALCSGAMIDPSNKNPHRKIPIPPSFNSIQIVRRPASEEHQRQAASNRYNPSNHIPQYCFTIEIMPYVLNKNGFECASSISLEVVR